MKEPKKNEYKEWAFKLNNGETVKLTISFGKLRKLQQVNEGAYEAYNKALTSGKGDMLGFIAIVYAGYLCANIDSEDLICEDDFYELVPHDIQYTIGIATEMITSKKKQDSKNPS